MELQLRAEQYKTEAEEATARTEALKESAKGADKEVDKLGRDSVKTAAEMKALGVAGEGAGKKLDAAAKQASTAMEALDQKIADARARVKLLSEDFQYKEGVRGSGSTAALQQAVKDVEDLVKWRAKLARTLKDLKDMEGQAGDSGGSSSGWFKNLFSGANWAGVNAGTAFNGGFLSSLGNIAAAAAPVLVPAAAVLVSELLSAAGGALLVGGGLSVIMAAAVIQMKSSPALAAAGSNFWGWFKNQMVAATQDFRAPLAQSFTILKTELVGPLGDLRGTFAKLAPYTQVFATYLGEAVQKFMPGFLRFLQASGPVLGMFARELPTIANGLNIMFDEMGKGAKGEGEALNVLIKAVSLALAGLGFVVRGAASVWDFFLQKTELALGVLTKVAGWVPGLGAVLGGLYKYVDGASTSMDGAKTSADGFGVSIGDLSGAVGQTATQVQVLATSFQNLSKGLDAAFGRTMGVDQATLQLATSMSGLADSVQKNGTSLKENTKQGQANLGVIQTTIGNINSMRDANIANGDSIDTANGKYESQLDQLKKTLIHLGFNKDAIQAIIDKYKQIPGQVSTIVNVLGLDAANTILDSITTKFNDLNGRVVTTYLVTDTTTGQQSKVVRSHGAQRWGGIYEHAETGLLSAGIYSPMSPARYAFAEPATGGEGFVPRFGDYMRSTSIIDQEARWYGGRFTPGGGSGAMPAVNVYVTAKDGAAQAILGMIDVRIEQAGSATAAAVSGGVRL